VSPINLPKNRIGALFSIARQSVPDILLFNCSIKFKIF
jgi:hypothetical protein